MWSRFRLIKSCWWVVGVSLLTALAFGQKINLPTADLGRHLVNGQLIWSQGLQSPLFSQNYYSFTNPEFTFPNHHWLYGVIVWPIWQILGFSGLSLLNLSLIFLSLVLVLIQAARYDKKTWAAVWFLSLPLIIDRTEIRPESFSLLFGLLFGFLLNKFSQKHLSGPWLLMSLTFIELIWVNLHLFFGLGIILVGYYWFKTWLEIFINQDKTARRRAGWLSVILLVITLITLLNPNGWRGALVPLTIFAQYQYPIAENQSTLFFLHYWPDRLIYWYYSGFALLSLSNLISSLKKNSLVKNLSHCLWLAPLLLAGLLMVRLYPFVALIVLPLNVKLLDKNLQNIKAKIPRIFQSNLFWSITSPLGFGLVLAIVSSGLFVPSFAKLGLGVDSKVLEAGEFLKKIPPTAHIFNNYDVGGYLIFQGFAQKVFVDNRPEFYPADFMQDTYIAAQKDEQVWQKIEEKYHLDIIFFYRHDATDWGQPFLIKRLKDPSWIPIYVDNYFLCLAKTTPENQTLIDQYRLPAETFSY